MASGGQRSPEAALHHLKALVKNAIGVDSVTVIQGRRAIWLALPEIAKTTAEDMVARVRRDFATNLADKKVIDVGDLHVKMASYPEDGKLPEQLINYIVL